MKSIYFRSFNNPELQHHFIDPTSTNSIDFLKENIFDSSGIPIEDQVLYWNGKLIYNQKSLESLSSGAVIDVSLRLQGGKGGLRNQLRGEMRKMSKGDNIDSSRDLMGRRIRDVRIKEKLKEWLRKKKEEDRMIQKEDKLEKWESEMSSAVRRGVKATRKGAETVKLGVRVSDQDEEEPAILKKIFTEIELAKLIEEKNDQDSEAKKIDLAQESLIKEEIKVEEAKVVYQEIDLSQVGTIEDLINLGPEHLKHELMRLGLKCGGDLKERAQRLFDIKMNPNLLFNPKYIAKKKTL